MKKRFNFADAVAILERTPGSLGALLNGLPNDWIRATEGQGTWSPYDVIGHLIHGERTDWIPRARHILDGKTERFERFDRTAQFTESKGKDLAELLATFAELRRANLASLVAMNLTDADFSDARSASGIRRCHTRTVNRDVGSSRPRPYRANRPHDGEAVWRSFRAVERVSINPSGPRTSARRCWHGIVCANSPTISAAADLVSPSAAATD